MERRSVLKAFSIFTALLVSLACHAQIPTLATDNIDDSTSSTFTIRMHKIESSCLSTPSDELRVIVFGDSSFILLKTDGNSLKRDSIVGKLLNRNILLELKMFEIEVNNKYCENESFLIDFEGPIHRRRYGTCDPKLLSNWFEAL